MSDPSAVSTFLFTDIEGSSRMWEQDPERMQPALKCHDALAHAAVKEHRGRVVKSTGDGILAAFDDPVDAVRAVLQLQLAIADPGATQGVALRLRCGLHAGTVERRDGDVFGNAVNRAARIMSTAHGGQILLSQPVAALVRDRLPQGAGLHDLGSVRLRDLASSEQVFQLTHPNLRREFPALRSLDATPNNLPQQTTSFVGRERELAEVKALLSRTRLLTLVGAGGIGKTRLSLQVAADLIDEFPDGIWFVELALLTDRNVVPQAVATVLGVREEAGLPAAEALTRSIGDRRQLIILDNCEHVVLACAELVETLLQAGPNLKILASSREHLHVASEATYSVPALAVPGTALPATPEAMASVEAVRLFTERAVAANSGFVLESRNAAAVAEICQRLDGIPLALELAAARVRAMSVENIAARLHDRFHLLTGGRRTDLPRRQTLRALIDWSHDLLTEPERILFRRLSVFAAGWTLEAAEAVGAGGELPTASVLDVLTGLVDKSLVTSDVAGGRYRMLETMRQYAEERLAASGEADAVRARFLGYFVALAEQAQPSLSGPDQATWLKRLDLERENLLAAHVCADQSDEQAELDLRMLTSAKRYLITRGFIGLGYRLIVEALARPGAQRRNLARNRALLAAGQFGYLVGSHDEARIHLEESLAIARELGDPHRVAVVLQPLGQAYLGQGDIAKARECLDEALALARASGDPREIATATAALAQLHRVEGALDLAEPLYEQALALARKLEDGDTIALALLNLAMVSIMRGTHARGRAMLLEAQAIAEEIGSERAGQSALEVAAGLASSRRDWGRAARWYGAAEAHSALTGIRADPADRAYLDPLIEQARQALGVRAFAADEAAGRTLTYDQAMGETRAWLEVPG